MTSKSTAIDTFLRNGGTFVVLRPVPNALDRERRIISLRDYRKVRQVREMARQKDCVDLVISTPDDVAVATVGDTAWPTPIFVDELRLPDESTYEGHFLMEARTHFGNSSITEYWRLRIVKELLDTWATNAKLAIERVLRVRMIRRGRIVICGAEPFIGLLAAALAPGDEKKFNWHGPLNDPIYRYPGFFLNLTDAGNSRIWPMPTFGPHATMNVYSLPIKR